MSRGKHKKTGQKAKFGKPGPRGSDPKGAHAAQFKGRIQQGLVRHVAQGRGRGS